MEKSKSNSPANWGAKFEAAGTVGTIGTTRKSKYRYGVGIDAGTNTGFAVYDFTENKLLEVKTVTFTEATNIILEMKKQGTDFFVRFEDARKRRWYGKKGVESLQGAGSIKRECGIWEEWLTYYSIPFEMYAPNQNITKLKSDYFGKLTGWVKKTNEHGRDACMLIFKKPKIY